MLVSKFIYPYFNCFQSLRVTKRVMELVTAGPEQIGVVRGAVGGGWGFLFKIYYRVHHKHPAKTVLTNLLLCWSQRSRYGFVMSIAGCIYRLNVTFWFVKTFLLLLILFSRRLHVLKQEGFLNYSEYFFIKNLKL